MTVGLENTHIGAEILHSHRAALAQASVTLQIALNSDLSEQNRNRYAEDAEQHLDYLSAAIMTEQPALFDDYVNWARTLCIANNVRLSELVFGLECLRDVLNERLAPEISQIASTFIDHSLKTLDREPPRTPSFIQPGQPHAELAQRYLAALLSQDRRSASQVIHEAVQAGVDIKALYMDVFQPCQFEIGRLWHLNQVSIPQEHFCTAVTQTLIGHMYQAIFTTPRNGRTAVVACVGGELHDLGARMVADFLEIDGWDTLYLGANTPPESIAQMAHQNHADLLCISATISSHIREVIETIAAVREHFSRQGIAILVGGHPFRIAPDLWRQVGADGYAPDAQSAAQMASMLVAL